VRRGLGSCTAIIETGSTGTFLRWSHATESRRYTTPNLKEVIMRKFTRQKSADAPDVNIDFGAAAAKVARVFEPGEYKLRLESARVIHSNRNVSVALDLVELDSGGRVDGLPLWVDGPNSDAGTLTAKNQNLIAQLLTLAKLPTSGNVSDLIPKLAGLEFGAHLALDVDSRSGRRYNATAVALRGL
jgi:hypothetical protein